ncbi:orotidine-monophosphate-decarboxylase [Listeria ivanovii FSL F6-596]|nr:orotidine-monophosphate-decarboxylase [Listeria ivanovii FSL F6-596]
MQGLFYVKIFFSFKHFCYRKLNNFVFKIIYKQKYSFYKGL